LEKDHKGLKLKGKAFQIRKITRYGKHFENTHVESLEAKRQLDERGFRSALFVSSPYHMKRLYLISRTVFNRNKYTLTFIPSRFQQGFTLDDWSNKRIRNMIFREYLKMGWFLMYAPFAID
jgi:uncharacterized SAM-binding protein YcdF (DUF218 family)